MELSAWEQMADETAAMMRASQAARAIHALARRTGRVTDGERLEVTAPGVLSDGTVLL